MSDRRAFSYYGPHWRLECAGCGEDHSVFGGFPLESS